MSIGESEARCVGGAVLYLAQLLTNPHRHVRSDVWSTIVLIVGGLMFVRLAITVMAHYFDGGAETLSASLSGLGEALDPRQIINLRDYDIGLLLVMFFPEIALWLPKLLN